jgi:hypothetical protein
VSFAIEPIQLPIVPLNWFRSHSLRTTTACKHAALCGAPSLCSVAAQSSSQTLEVRELAELRRQRAAQAVSPQCPATARQIGSNRGSGGADHATCSTRTTPPYVGAHTPVRRGGAHRNVSFAIEPIQLPILPLNWLCWQSLHTTTACKHAALCGAPSLCSVAAQSSSQTLEVVSLPSSVGSVPRRPLPPSALPQRVRLDRVEAPLGDHTTCSTYYQRRHVGSTRMGVELAEPSPTASIAPVL